MRTVVWTVRAAAFSEILRGIAGAGAAADAGEAAGVGAAADGANKAATEQAKPEEKAGTAASKQAAAFKDDRNAAVVVLLSGGAPTGTGACTPSRSPCRRCVCFRSTC
tara:strand:- start:308 stop:631 length:324 start_codon:yes stop_codon:yes gene_type:complete